MTKKRVALLLSVLLGIAAIAVIVAVTVSKKRKKKSATTMQQQTFAAAGPSGKTTLTSYNVMSSDNTAPGALAEWKVPRELVNSVNIAAVHSRDWPTYKYHMVRITMNGKSGDFVIADYCSDGDCGGCCTKNMRPNNFLLDMDSTAVKKIWNIGNAEKSLKTTGEYRIGQAIDVKTEWPKLGAKWDGG